MPPDTPKPLATSTVHDIAVIVRRTGMEWKEFNPSEGNMSAEGGVHIITGTILRGMGTVLQYRCLNAGLLVRGIEEQQPQFDDRLRTIVNEARKKNKDWWYELENLLLEAEDDEKADKSKRRSIAAGVVTDGKLGGVYDERDRRPWTKSMDALIFGVIPNDPQLNIPSNYAFATADDCIDTLSRLTELPLGLLDNAWRAKLVVTDLFFMCAPLLRDHSGGLEYLSLKEYPQSAIKSTLWQFSALLKAYLNPGLWVERHSELDQYRDVKKLTEQELNTKVLGELMKGRKEPITDGMGDVLGKVEWMVSQHQQGLLFTRQTQSTMVSWHIATTDYFVRSRVSFHPLLKAHFYWATAALNRAHDGWQNRDEWVLKPFKEAWEPTKSNHANIEMLLSYIPDYVRFMKEKEYCDDETAVEEAWLTLMLRAYLFSHLHGFEADYGGIYVPSKYFESQLPVYLA